MDKRRWISSTAVALLALALCGCSVMRPALEAMYDEFRYPYLDEWRVPCVVLANDDLQMPWNDYQLADDPLKPWNDPRYASDPYAPWNDPLAGEHEYQTYCDQKWIPEGDR